MPRSRCSRSERRRGMHRSGSLLGAGLLEFEISDEGQF